MRAQWRQILSGLGAFRRKPASLGESPDLLPWLPFCMALGIGFWFLLKFEPGRDFYAMLAVLIIGLIAALGLIRHLALRESLGWQLYTPLRLGLLGALAIASGTALIGARAYLVAAPVLEFRYYGPVEGRVIGIDRSSRDRMRITLDRIVLKDVSPTRSPLKLRISLMNPPQHLPDPGQHIMLTAHLGPPPAPAEPGGFDFRRVAWFQSLGAVGYTRSPIVTIAPADENQSLMMHRFRLRLSAAIMTEIGGQSGAIAAALMTGDRSGIEERTNELMRISNLYHIISISGLHMSMLAGFVYAALRLLGVLLQSLRPGLAGFSPHKPAAIGALAASAVYLWLSGGGVATERSFIMVAVMLTAILVDRRALSLRTLALAAVLIFLYAPEGLTDVGFQMSFVATTALILSHRPWMAVSKMLPWWSKPLALLVISSAVAGLATAPIAAAHFGRMAQYGVWANLLVVPAMGAIVMPAGVLAAILAPFGLAAPALWLMGLGTGWMLKVANWFAAADSAVLHIQMPSTYVLPLMAIGALLLILPTLPIAQHQQRLAAVRSLAAMGFLITSILIWALERRPDLLISGDGNAVGISNLTGRVLSKGEGGAFAVASWLEADGDMLSQTEAALRPGWDGQPYDRQTQLGTFKIRHLTGKKSQEVADQDCIAGQIIVTNQASTAARRDGKNCYHFNPQTLRRSGAIAFWHGANGVRYISETETSGQRFWSGAGYLKRKKLEQKFTDFKFAEHLR